jgi:predicted DNA-binding transcriptional regulator AlpA
MHVSAYDSAMVSTANILHFPDNELHSPRQSPADPGSHRSSAPLTSWKEIASHLGKGVRTVQRWERELHFPLHRPDPKKHVVIAYPGEIDAWITRRERASRGAEAQLVNLFEDVARLLERHPELLKNADEQCRTLADKIRQLGDSAQKKHPTHTMAGRSR